MVRFITFEGGDGSGKSTQLKLVEGYLAGLGKSCIATREPGGTSLGNLIRQVLLEVRKRPIAPPAELFLYLADRAQHIEAVISPALEQGKIVLCDRHTDSTLAYQGYGRGIDLELLRRLNEMASRGIKPDLTFLFDCAVEVGLSRTAHRQSLAGRGGKREDRFERENVDFHERVRQGFLELARLEPDRFCVIPAADSVELVFEQVKKIVNERVCK
jgi:dTMP kinase